MKKRILIVAENGMNQLAGIPRVIASSTLALKDDCDFDLLVFKEEVDEYKQQYSHFANILHTF